MAGPPPTLALALEHLRSGRADEALAVCRTLIERDPADGNAWHLQGMIAAQRNDHAAARRALETAAALAGSNPFVLSNLGNVLQALGEAGAAIEQYRRALALKPDFAEAHYNLGKALAAMGDDEAAVDSYRRAIALRPDYVDAGNNLGNLLRAQWRLEEAAQVLRDAVARQPHLAEAHNNLGLTLKAQDRTEEAERCFRAAIAANPDLAGAHHNLGQLLADQGRHHDSVGVYTHYLQRRPDPGMEVRRALALPRIPRSLAEIHAVRRQLEERVADLSARGIGLRDPLAEVGTTTFFLAYHGLDDRPIQTAVADFYRRSCPSLTYVAAHCRSPARPGARLRIGFVSTFFYSHTIGRLYRGLVEHLDRRRFETVLFMTPPLHALRPDDPLRALFGRAPEHVVPLPFDLERAREIVAQQRLDILYFTDIGMTPLTYFLAFARLAPLQCLTFGHPDTTGIDTLDRFISSAAMEPPDSQHHYSERLVTLPGSTVCYERPAMPARRGRADFGLPVSGPLYICPQTLFKLHPDFDAALGELLRRDAGHVALISGGHDRLDRLVRERIAAQAGGEAAARLHFLPGMSRPDFMALAAQADVLLDPFHFSGGNSSLEALAFGTPIVTLPGAFMRGRTTYGFYALMGVDSCVARDAAGYIDLAHGLATDPRRRAAAREEIEAANAVLYDDRATLRAIGDSLVQAHAERLGGDAGR